MQALQTQPSLVIGVAATLASTPLVMLLAGGVSGVPLPVELLLRVSPLLTGLGAVTWYGILRRQARVGVGAGLGMLTTLLTFESYLLVFSLVAWGLGTPNAATLFIALSFAGLLYFGWIALPIGALAGWLAGRVHEPEA